MIHLVCYLKREKTNEYIIDLLCNIFKVNRNEITSLLNEKESLIKFESRVLDNISEFGFELNIFIRDDKKVNDFQLKSNVLLGVAISNNILEEVVVSDKKYIDPDQWILIDHHKLFLVEEEDTSNSYGISLNKNNKTEITDDFL